MNYELKGKFLTDLQYKLACEAMGKEPINTIGTCFESSFAQLTMSENVPPDAKLVHGIGVATMPGQENTEIGHAWIEYDLSCGCCRSALDTTWGLTAPFQNYRKQLSIEYVKEYTLEDAMKIYYVFKTPGPWDQKILDITKRQDQCMRTHLDKQDYRA